MRGSRAPERRGLGPFSGRQLTIMFVALVVGVVLAPVVADAANANGIGVAGVGRRFGGYSNGPLGISTGQPLRCAGCVGTGAISSGSATDAWSKSGEIRSVVTSRAVASTRAPASRYLVQWDADGEAESNEDLRDVPLHERRP